MKCVPYMIKKAPYNKTIYMFPDPFFPPPVLCVDKNFVVYWLCSLILPRCIPTICLRKPTPYR